MKTYLHIHHKKLILFGISILSIFVSCKKLVEPGAPITSTNKIVVFENDGTAISALSSIYALISSNIQGTDLTNAGPEAIGVYTGLSSDELTLFNSANQAGTNYYPYYSNSLTVNNNLGNASFWNVMYPLVFDANSAIEGLNGSSGLTPAIKNQLLGEAKFFRAFFYFYLVNLYGDVPLVTSTDYNKNRSLSRLSQDQVYQQIIADLKDAQQLLVDKYVGGDLIKPTTERTSLNKWAATALLARVYLYKKDYVNAEIQASTVIANSQYALVPLGNVFLSNNQEAIWQLQPTYLSPTTNTREAWLYVLQTGSPDIVSYPVYLSDGMVNSFEPNDNRKSTWTGNVIANSNTYYYPFKYQNATPGAPVTEYETVLRLAEQYLIRSEAEAQEGKIGPSQNDLNTIRNRAGLPNTLASDKASLVNAILHERQVELFTEWGHRWLDIKRSGIADAIMGSGGVCAAKGGTWNSNWQLYPIPISEITLDHNLNQNPGY